MLAEAKIFTRSAPSALRSRTCSRICSGVSFGLLIWPSDDSKRGPGSTPRAIASRSALSRGEPTLCTVVNPAISVT
jgi:hypothetical protein